MRLQRFSSPQELPLDVAQRSGERRTACTTCSSSTTLPARLQFTGSISWTNFHENLAWQAHTIHNVTEKPCQCAVLPTGPDKSTCAQHDGVRIDFALMLSSAENQLWFTASLGEAGFHHSEPKAGGDVYLDHGILFRSKIRRCKTSFSMVRPQAWKHWKGPTERPGYGRMAWGPGGDHGMHREIPTADKIPALDRVF
jgi:hypothetical protein